MYQKLSIKFLISLLALFLSNHVYGQVDKTVKSARDTIPGDSTITTVDSASVDKSNENDLKSPIKYSAKDSMMFSVKHRMIYSYGEAKLEMEEMKLDAGQIKMNIDSNYVYAQPIKNVEGEETGAPVFKQGQEEYKIKKLKYNIKTHKGIVYDVVTDQGGGFLHAQITKMQPNKEIHMINGMFTTCDAEHPHFYMHLTKAKVVPDKKIISGPFWFVLSDIPIPIGLPFGWFPVRKNKTAGFILPAFTEEQNRGFGLQHGGYYYPIGEYADLTVLGEIWTSGSWGIDINSNYKRIYRYSGSSNISYKKFKTADTEGTTQFAIRVNYARDPKASPSSTFNASVNFMSSGFRRLESYNPNTYANNTTSSSIAYTKTFPGFSFSANMGATQNLTSHLMNMELPTITFNMTRRLKPFERKGNLGKKRWYEETQVGFSSNLRNSIEATDTTLFTQKTLDKMKSSANYSIPVSTTIKLFKYFNLTPSFSYNGKFNTKYLRNQYYPARVGPGDVIQKAGFYTDTVSGINHVYDFSFSAPLTTTLYGMVQFKKSKISAIRHVMSPAVSFGLTPDFGAERWGYYTKDTTNGTFLPNYFSVPGRGRSGSLGFSLGNNLEMKVHSKDTTEKLKKIVLLQNLNFTTAYNLAADSFNWAPISINASTTLFKQVSVSYNGGVDLYTRDSAGKAQNITYMKRDGKLGHYNRHSLTLSGSISSETFKKKKTDNKNNANNQTGPGAANNEIPGQTTGKLPGENNAQKPKDGKTDADGYSFGMPWSVSLNLILTQDRTKFNTKTQNFDRDNTATLTLNGNISLTPKWKVNGSMSFNFMDPKKKLNGMNWSIHRDLHCWEMSFDFSPFGTYKHYSFRINVLSSMFQGMEFKRQQSYYDNLTF